MTNVRIAFEKIDGVTSNEIRKGEIKPGYKHINVHMIFDIKMYEHFTRRAILVAYDHTTALPSSITYPSIVSREGVWI